MENEVRLIDAIALHKILEEAQDGTRRIYSSLVDYRDKEVCKGELGTYARVKRVVEEAPTIDPESLRPKGRWAAINADCRGYANAFECSNCETISHTHTYMKECEFEYCPVCGAKMGVEADD